MAFPDHYPLEQFLSISHVAWWRSSDVQSVTSRGYADARKAGTTYVVPEELKEAQRVATAADAADKIVWEAGKEVFLHAVTAHLLELRDAGALAPTGGLRGRDVWQASAWNAFVAGEPDDHHTRWLFGLISNALTHYFVRMDDGRFEKKKTMPLGHHEGPSVDKATIAWEAICASMDSGDSGERWNGWPIECQDQKTGDRCELRFDGWTATLMRQTPSYDFEPAGDVGPLPLAAASFDVPSGELLLTDFLRVEGMNESTDFGDDEHGEDLSLSSELGRVNRTNRHAADHDMGFCQTTNTCVSVWRNPTSGVLAVVPRWGGDEEDEVDGASPVKGWDRVGDFSCDVWRVTAIDLTVARRHTKEGALDAYLALRGTKLDVKGLNVATANQKSHEHCYANNVVSVTVQPGRWTIHCGDDFHKRLPRSRYGLPKGVKPWCVLTPPKAAKGRRKAA